MHSSLCFWIRIKFSFRGHSFGLTPSFGIHFPSRGLNRAGPDSCFIAVPKRPGMSGGPQASGGDAASTSEIAAYFLAHTTTGTWILAVPSAQAGGDLVSLTGKPFMCLGGFSGNDQLLDVTSLEDYIRKEKVRYFETGGSMGSGMGGGNSEIFSWVSDHCTVVNLTGDTGTEATSASGTRSGVLLYDCKGAAGMI